jgi:site-specific recombinase XerD
MRLHWCDEHRLELHEIEAVTVAAYIEQLGNQASKPTVKQHLAAIRQLFDYLTTGGIWRSTQRPRCVGRSTW